MLDQRYAKDESKCIKGQLFSFFFQKKAYLILYPSKTKKNKINTY